MALLFPVLAFAQSLARDSVKVYFRQGKTEFDPSYQGNGRRFTDFSNKARAKQRDTTVNITRVLVYASTSPEGTAEANERIAYSRAQNIAEYLSLMLHFDPSSFEVHLRELDWPLFEKLVREDPYVPMRLQLLPLIEARDLKRIKVERFQRTWDYLLENVFPEMRSTVVVFEYEAMAPLPAVSAPSLTPERSTAAAPAANASATSAPSSAGAPVTDVPPVGTPNWMTAAPPLPDDDELDEEYDFSNEWPWSCYVKTNLLPWALLDMNIAVEFEIGRHMSFSLPVYYSAADWFSVENKFRVMGTQPELRFWFRDNFSGPFLGVHGTLAYYNVALKNGTYRFQDRAGQTPAYGGGAHFGWKFRFDPHGADRWGLELSVGGGYLHLDYDMFYNVENGRYSSSEVRDYYGLDHASIALTYRFGKRR